MKFLRGSIRIEGSPVCMIEEFATDMVELSKRLGITVVCDVNSSGIDMRAIHGVTTSETVVKIWRHELALQDELDERKRKRRDFGNGPPCPSKRARKKL